MRIIVNNIHDGEAEFLLKLFAGQRELAILSGNTDFVSACEKMYSAIAEKHPECAHNRELDKDVQKVIQKI